MAPPWGFFHVLPNGFGACRGKFNFYSVGEGELFCKVARAAKLKARQFEWAMGKQLRGGGHLALIQDSHSHSGTPVLLSTLY